MRFANGVLRKPFTLYSLAYRSLNLFVSLRRRTNLAYETYSQHDRLGITAFGFKKAQ